MADIVRMALAEPVLYGVLKIQWADGYAGIVDLRGIFEEGDMFAFMRRTPERFSTVILEDHGHKLFWLDDDGDEIDFGAQSLRDRAERQAEILLVAS